MRPIVVIAAAAIAGIITLLSDVQPGGDTSGSNDAPVRDAGEHGSVAQVIDGDTIHLTDGRRVRLVQIDAPEVHPVMECGGAQARAALRERLLAGDVVELEVDPALDAEDQHGRLLRYVLADGENLNLWLVERGHAETFFFRGDRGRHARELSQAQRDAREAGRAMWSCPQR